MPSPRPTPRASTGAHLEQRPQVVADAFTRAVAAARAYAGATAPNPPVGCVALDAAGAVLACEGHERAGGPHAEAAAIQACERAGSAGRIHTLVVTLEPCNHCGRTPPCADAILATSAQSVWIGAHDPNPHVAGGGASRLAAAGLAVRFIDDLRVLNVAELAHDARRLIAPFARWSRDGRPWITVKQALTPEGRMIPPAGRKTFTSETSLDFAHKLRRRADAIITGSGCVLADDPAFTVRRVRDHAGKRRFLVILDRRRRVPDSYERAAAARGFDVWMRSDLAALPEELAAAGVIEALVEAGPTLTGSLLELGLWDEHVTIRQGPLPGLPDRVDVRLRAAV